MTKKHKNWGWVFVSPYIIGFLVFSLYPIVFSGYISFTDYDIFNPPQWVGFKNYITALNMADLWMGFRNVFTYVLILETLQISIGCILAVLLNHAIKGISAFRVMYFMPVLTPIVAVSFVWTYMYNPMYGVLNYLFKFIGLGPFKFTFSGLWVEVVASIAVMSAWKGVGYTTIYLLAGLQNISTDVNEAARIDGAGAVRKFFNITLPLLSPMIFFLLMKGVIDAMQVFDAFYVMQQATGANTTVIGTLIYNNAFEYSKFGLASAIGWISFIVIAILTLIQKRAEKRWVYYE
ncbi:MAG: sugar ABC transporter permease [Clostridia bacterium]|nr:sugar ABC transporter permease [Clostridia bacterium]